jgi:glycosyltransferase involved in cell wall biosynthesis
MLRVALVITELDVGGAERQLVQLATGLDRRFFKPRVFALGTPPKSGQDELVQRLKEAEVPVEFFNARRWWQAGPTIEKLAAKLRGFQPSIMQSFLFHGNVIGTLAARKAGVPHVSLGMRVNDPRWWRTRIEAHAARRAERVVCVSQGVATAVRRRLRLSDEQVIVIPNGVDADRFAHAAPADVTKFGVPADVRPLIFVGRLDRQKGVDRLLELAPALTSLQTHLLVVGSGPLDASLRAAAQRMSPTRIHFAGWQPNVAPLLAASSLLVLPSRYEGMPNVLLEAMAAGLPVLTTPVEGVREILGDDVNQQAVPFDVATWHDALARLLRSPEHAAAIGIRNRECIRQQFSMAAMIEHYERLFSGLAQALYRR